jgi:fermentation-respiration switch protein FrsA (DUF1100 family)
VVSYRVADSVTRPERKPLDPPAASIASVYEDVSFRSRDGLLLKGWWFPVAGTDRAVVMVHGRGGNRVNSSFQPAKIAQFLLANRFSVLLFDLRAHGESEGTRFTLGAEEPRDILAAIDFAQQKGGVLRQRVAIVAESMGGGSAIMTVGADPTIGPMVTDSAYAEATTVIGEVASSYTGLPSAFNPGIIAVSGLLTGDDILNVRPSAVVRAHPERAWLFIQCDNDHTVYPHHGTDLKNASANPDTELWVARGCEHVRAFTTYPAEWQARVLRFLERELARPR